MRGLSLVFLVIAIGAVLLISFRSFNHERNRLFQDFASAQAALAHDVAADLENRLKDLDEDAQLVSRLAHETWKSASFDGDRKVQVVRSAFRALATLVRHYRSVVLFPSDTTPPIMAIDPAEVATGAASLVDISRNAATNGGEASSRMSGPTLLTDGRPIYAYSIRTDEGTLVVSIDGARFLAALMRGRADSRLLIRDPGGHMWRGCAEPSGCGLLGEGSETGAINGLVAAIARGPSALRTASQGANSLGLPDGSFASAAARITSPDGRSWTVAVATAAGALERREQILLRQLIATAAGLLLAVGLIGAFIVRQQRRAVALTERLRHAEALRSLEDQLVRAEKLATTGVLAAGIAHEIGTPLGIIRGRAEMLLEHAAGETTTKGLNAIVQQIDHIAGTIRQVLDFSRAQPVEPQQVDALAVINEALELLTHRFRQQMISVEVVADSNLPRLAADRSQLQQVLINILINSCDAMAREGRLAISLHRTRVANRPGLEWEIRDNGAGIAAEHLHAVFDPFFTTKKRGEGTGLGLSVAASIVRNHGGDISLSSVVGEGTSVRLFWPSVTHEVAADV